jgi:hypothetical protein
VQNNHPGFFAALQPERLENFAHFWGNPDPPDFGISAR